MDNQLTEKERLELQQKRLEMELLRKQVTNKKTKTVMFGGIGAFFILLVVIILIVVIVSVAFAR